MNLGNKISEIRKKNKMSQEEFAELFNVTRQTISSWENSKSYPDIETLIKISDKLMIYYDKNNPTKISDGIVKHNEYILIILGLVIVLVAIFLFFNCKKEIEKEV